MRWVGPDESEELSDVVADIELVVELIMRSGTFDFYVNRPESVLLPFSWIEERRRTDIGVAETEDEILEGERVEVESVSERSSRIFSRRLRKIKHNLESGRQAPIERFREGYAPR